jgi:hypothetical protein
LFGIEELRGIDESRFEDSACDQHGERHNRDDCRRARQMTGAAVVAGQAARLAHYGGLRTDGISGWGRNSLSIAASHMRMTVMMMTGVIGIPGMRRGRHAVLTERHRHGCVALQREPQRDQHGQNRSPAVHRLSICHDIWLFQSSEPGRGAEVPYLSTGGGDLPIAWVAWMRLRRNPASTLLNPQDRGPMRRPYAWAFRETACASCWRHWRCYRRRVRGGVQVPPAAPHEPPKPGTSMPAPTSGSGHPDPVSRPPGYSRSFAGGGVVSTSDGFHMAQPSVHRSNRKWSLANSRIPEARLQ